MVTCCDLMEDSILACGICTCVPSRMAKQVGSLRAIENGNTSCSRILIKVNLNSEFGRINPHYLELECISWGTNSLNTDSTMICKKGPWTCRSSTKLNGTMSAVQLMQCYKL